MNLGWLRKVRRLTHVLIVAGVLTGLVVTWRAAIQADVLRAAIGAAATLGVLCSGTLWLASIRVGLALVRSLRRCDRLGRRLLGAEEAYAAQQQRLDNLTDELSTACEASRQEAKELADRVDQSHRRVIERVEGVVARVETFSKLHDGQAERLERRVSALESALRRGAASPDVEKIDTRDWADSNAPPGERTVAAYRHLVEQEVPADTTAEADVLAEKRKLRTDFAGLIHDKDYAAALAKGDELVTRFPESTAATDFRRVRPHLVRRIQLAKNAEPGRQK